MVKPIKRRSQLGFTLTEAMLVVALIGILAGIAAPLIMNLTNFWRQTTARNDIERDVRSSLDMINRFLRQARRITVVIDQASGQPPYSRITFQTEKGQTVSFYQAANDLMMSLTESGGSARVSRLSERLGFIAFTYPRTDDVSIISVAMTMQAPTYLGGKKALQLSIQKVRVMN
jgi:prepilin-type N-terminal cleavage/methylation domain-containing protein